jgi:hypothetical protein
MKALSDLSERAFFFRYFLSSLVPPGLSYVFFVPKRALAAWTVFGFSFYPPIP